MKLVAFQQKYTENPIIYINAAKVVAVQMMGKDTCIVVDVPNGAGAPFWYVVKESMDEAASKLTA